MTSRTPTLVEPSSTKPQHLWDLVDPLLLEEGNDDAEVWLDPSDDHPHVVSDPGNSANSSSSWKQVALHIQKHPHHVRDRHVISQAPLLHRLILCSSTVPLDILAQVMQVYPQALDIYWPFRNTTPLHLVFVHSNNQNMQGIVQLLLRYCRPMVFTVVAHGPMIRGTVFQAACRNLATPLSVLQQLIMVTRGATCFGSCFSRMIPHLLYPYWQRLKYYHRVSILLLDQHQETTTHQAAAELLWEKVAFLAHHYYLHYDDDDNLVQCHTNKKASSYSYWLHGLLAWQGPPDLIRLALLWWATSSEDENQLLPPPNDNALFVGVDLYQTSKVVRQSLHVLVQTCLTVPHVRRFLQPHFVHLQAKSTPLMRLLLEKSQDYDLISSWIQAGPAALSVPGRNGVLYPFHVAALRYCHTHKDEDKPGQQQRQQVSLLYEMLRAYPQVLMLQ